MKYEWKINVVLVWKFKWIDQNTGGVSELKIIDLAKSASINKRGSRCPDATYAAKEMPLYCQKVT